MHPRIPKPATLSEYLSWAKGELGIDHTEATQRWYKSNATAALNAASAHPFFRDLDSLLRSATVAYKEKYNTGLMMQGSLELQIKSYESALQKSFRINISRNNKFPAPPKDGWLTPDRWFERLNDIVRGMLVAKYIDGPGFLLSRFQQHAEEVGLQSHSATPYSENGYYAHHFYVHIPVEITTTSWEGTFVQMSTEIQVTTQLQEVMRALTHRFYSQEKERQREDNWKWDYSSDKFKASYLGHTLHLLEGIIVELRRRSIKDSSEDQNATEG